MKDVFHKINDRDAAAKREERKLVSAWSIRKSEGGPARSRLYSRVQAMRVVARAKRMGVSVFAANFGKVAVTTIQQANMGRARLLRA